MPDQPGNGWQGSRRSPYDSEERVVLLGLICTREPKLEQFALDLGARFFAEKSLAFERRLLRYGREWPTRPA